MPISLHIPHAYVFELGSDGFCRRELMEAGQSQNQKHHLNQNPKDPPAPVPMPPGKGNVGRGVSLLVLYSTPAADSRLWLEGVV